VEERIFEYLASHYGRLSTSQQSETLNLIIDRLVSKELVGRQIAMDIIRGLEQDANYSKGKVLAHLDMMDLEDRT
jgi:hypothetical protein